jgi:hypothetical protein
MLTSWRRERTVRRALRTLARQRVVIILQPGNVWVVERGPNEHDEDLVAALRTCHLRGWAEVVEKAVPQAKLGTDLTLPTTWEGVAPMYRLTEGGWGQLRRTHEWLIATFLVSLLSLVVGVMALYCTPH